VRGPGTAQRCSVPRRAYDHAAQLREGRSPGEARPPGNARQGRRGPAVDDRAAHPRPRGTARVRGICPRPPGRSRRVRSPAQPFRRAMAAHEARAAPPGDPRAKPSRSRGPAVRSPCDPGAESGRSGRDPRKRGDQSLRVIPPLGGMKVSLHFPGKIYTAIPLVSRKRCLRREDAG
jgi:hypothetical protein